MVKRSRFCNCNYFYQLLVLQKAVGVYFQTRPDQKTTNVRQCCFLIFLAFLIHLSFLASSSSKLTKLIIKASNITSHLQRPCKRETKYYPFSIFTFFVWDFIHTPSSSFLTQHHRTITLTCLVMCHWIHLFSTEIGVIKCTKFR